MNRRTFLSNIVMPFAAVAGITIESSESHYSITVKEYTEEEVSSLCENPYGTILFHPTEGNTTMIQNEHGTFLRVRKDPDGTQWYRKVEDLFKK